MRTIFGLTMAAMLVAASTGAALAQQVAGKITVVTSFSKDVTGPFKAAFEKAYPGTTLDMQNRNTNAGVKYIGETRSNNQVDIFWASAPDAFEVLKTQKLLQKYQPKVTGLPKEVGGYPLNDPEGTYFGFAVSGYGIMWNTRYMKANNLPLPADWADLMKPEYRDHVAIAAPSRSGTTHLTIESILQGEGWEKGWRTNKLMAGNYRQITERSFGVPDGVNSGQFGVGVVIDFFAFSAQASGYPVQFTYPKQVTVVPANIGIVANAPNAAGAQAFVEYVLSEPGQTVLLDPGIRRLPVNPKVYALPAAADLPNPFKGLGGGSSLKFDVDLSEKRTAVVDALYDQTITFQHEALKAAVKAIQSAEAKLKAKPVPAAVALVNEARDLVAAMPVTAEQAVSADILAAFAGGKTAGSRQAELEQQWAAFAKDRYAAAKAKAEEAEKLAR